MPPTSADVWDKEIPVPESTISYVDDGILKKLPEGTQPVGILPSGASYWARTAKIEALNAQGEPDDYFLKVHQGEKGKLMVSSEFEAMSALYRVMPEMVARPVAWGSYESLEDTHFFVCEFRELSDEIPDPYPFAALMAELHKRGTSADGMFGMPYVTFGGNNPQYFPVTNNWEECFTAGLQAIFAAERKTHGADDEMDQMTTIILEKVIPRLLRPLETEGRTVIPRLVHGDLWDGNTSVDVNTGGPMIYDATPLYAHSEYDLGPWKIQRHKMTQAYIDEYVKHSPKSEPIAEFDDRLWLYCLRFDMHASSLYPGNLRFRNICKDNMRRLIERYGEGYEGYLAKKNLETQSKIN